MAEAKGGWTDQRVEQLLGNLLRAGVVTAALVVLVGAVPYLVSRGSAPPDLRVFRGEPAELRSPVGIVKEALKLRDEAIIQFGLLLLIATPVARVVFSVIVFALQRDLFYVAVTLIVLGVLLFSLFSGHVG
jgi:uncharacterized membrane protein